jgi:hypothetical protein
MSLIQEALRPLRFIHHCKVRDPLFLLVEVPMPWKGYPRLRPLLKPVRDGLTNVVSGGLRGV